ncbi:MAG: hypothetical protein DRG78_14945 [Epsilonproteobacteria bacterium]|nr:MAG: hypothetical protein DRG78_14945 [Campylobacterota bacterium]
MTLSKSQYIRGLQCHKSLWLYKNRPELRDEVEESTESLFDRGYQVGDIAKELFVNGVEIAFDSDDFDGMIAKTKELIADGTEIIYEATFKENGIFAMVDILVKNGSSWDMYEVKSSTKVKEYHINDTAIQWYALFDTLNLNRAYVVHVNSEYTRDGEISARALLSRVDITEQVLQRQEEIPTKLHMIEKMLKGDTPDIDIGRHCSDPFGCDFKSYC